MSRLEFYARPLVAFDANNKNHRRYYAEFLENNGWGRCPVRFICIEEHGLDLPTMIKNSFVDYYVSREFGGNKLSDARALQISRQADSFYKKAGRLRKEAQMLTRPRST